MPSLMDEPNAELTGTFIVISTYIKKKRQFLNNQDNFIPQATRNSTLLEISPDVAGGRE